MKSSKRVIFSLVLIVSLLVAPFSQTVQAAGTSGSPQDARTIMLFAVGSNLEDNFGKLSFNLKQAMDADIADNVNVIVLTSGCNRWFLNDLPELREDADYSYDPTYLYDAAGKETQIDAEKKQIWKLTGKTKDGHHGKMTLLGTLDDTVGNITVLDPSCLTAFINYALTNCPAKMYDLILWDHGYGSFGFGLDFSASAMAEIKDKEDFMTLAEMAKGIRESQMTGAFETINFDACLMSNVDALLAVSPYANYVVASPELVPDCGENYAWLSKLSENPAMDGFSLGKVIVDGYVDFYENDPLGEGADGAFSVINTDVFLRTMLPNIEALTAIPSGEAVAANFYDEMQSSLLSYKYGYEGTIDVGRFADRLAEKITENKNAYIAAAANIRQNLSDPSLIYTNYTKGMAKKAGTPSGMNLYFPDPTVSVAADYLSDMDELITEMKISGSPYADEKVSVLQNEEQNAVYYGLIQAAGKSVSDWMRNSGKKNVTLSMVKKAWKKTDDFGTSVWKSGVRTLYQRAKTYGNADTWLTGIIKAQTAEQITAKKITTTAKSSAYVVKVKQTKKRAIDQSVGLTGEMQITPREGGDAVSLGGFDGTLKSAAKKTVTYRVRRVTNRWYALKDTAGKQHLISFKPDENDPTTAYVSVCFEKEEMTDDGYPYIDGINGDLVVKQSGNAYQIIGFRKNTEAKITALSAEDFSGYTLYAASATGWSGYTKLNSKAPIAFTSGKDNLGLTVKANVALSKMDDVTKKMKKSFQETLTLTDLYGGKVTW